MSCFVKALFVTFAFMFTAVYSNIILPPDYSYRCPTSDCQCATLPNRRDAVQLVCITNHLDNSTTQLQKIPTEYTTWLTVSCNIHHESRLWNGMFSHLVNLQELTLIGCSTKRVPAGTFAGLMSLHTLNFIGSLYQTVWDSNVFAETQNIQRLTVYGVKSLPQGLLCPLRNLRHLNLSLNVFEKISDLGVCCREENTSAQCASCVGKVQELDISQNFLNALPSEFSRVFPMLQVLFLKNNTIKEISGRAFTGLTDLDTIDLSHNEIKSLHAGAFVNLTLLRILLLNHNRIEDISRGIFSNTTSLERLDLGHNFITSDPLDNGLIKHLPDLKMLLLNDNHITYLNPGMLNGVTKLHTLNLNHNVISRVSQNTFGNLRYLFDLNLGSNQIDNIDEDLLSGPTSLRALDLSNNAITTINPDAFKHMYHLYKLNMSHNRLTHVPRTIQYLGNLVILDMRENRISKLTPMALMGLNSLMGLSLENNLLVEIKRSVFYNTPKVQVLNLGNNIITRIEPGAFDSLLNLVYLYLDNNNITSIAYLLDRLSRLTVLKVDNNKLTELNAMMFPRALRRIDLSRNRISKIGPKTFYNMPFLVSINLRNNHLREIELDSIELSLNANPGLPKHTEMQLSVNPLTCNCHIPTFLQSIRVPITNVRRYPRIIDLNLMFCFDRFREKVTWLNDIDTRDKSQTLCKSTDICVGAICPCCAQGRKCWCNQICPDECTCFRTLDMRILYVNCTQRLLTNVPKSYSGATNISLANNNISTIGKNDFFNQSNVEYLYLDNSHIENIEEFSFRNMSRLQVLDLSNNKLGHLSRWTVTGLNQLRDLRLNNNRLQYIDTDIFLELRKLRVLHLQRNLLKTIAFTNIERLDNLHETKMADNPWTCDCDYIAEFKAWLFKDKSVVSDRNSLECTLGPLIYNNSSDEDGNFAAEVENNTTRVRLSVFDFHYYCGNSSIAYNSSIIVRVPERFDGNTKVLIAILVVFVMLVILSTTVYYYRYLIKVWLYSRYGLRPCYKMDDDDNKEYDAFVSYSSNDEDYIVHTLAPKLERDQPSYKLCLHYRDFPIGGSIADTIVRSVENSKRTIMLLSKNYLESEWCIYEFKTAHHRVLQDRTNRLIVILHGDIDTEKLDPDLNLYLKTNTYLKWDDPWFWEKLHYAMPDVPTKNNLQTHGPVRYRVNGSTLNVGNVNGNGNHRDNGRVLCNISSQELPDIMRISTNLDGYQENI